MATIFEKVTVEDEIPQMKLSPINVNCKIHDENDEEPELTSLTWLTELRNQNLTWPNSLNMHVEEEAEKTQTSASGAIQSDSGVKSKNRRSVKTKAGEEGVSKNAPQQPQQLTPKRSTPAERYKIFLDKIKRDLKEYQQSAEKYQTDSSEKPPFNYSHIIGMAMLEKGRVTLQQICAWIEAQFAFFRVRKKWNNSIRHNLSLHHCFRKINRNKYEKGKGGYWELGIDPKKCDRKRIRNRKSNKSKLKALTAAKSNEICESIETYEMQQEPEEHQSALCSNDQQESYFDYGEYCVAPPVEDSQQLNQLYVAEGPEAPQYHLGTIIISTSAVDESDMNNFEPRQLQLNNMAYQEEDRPVFTDFAETYDVMDRMQQTNIVHQRANVIVEQVFPNPVATNQAFENGSSRDIALVEHFVPAANGVVTVPSSTAIPTVSEQNSMCFTPYIDGIEEAFQYLRSIDQSNREDILDNILDISVSDY